jgi:hypothetical protein
LHACLMGRPPAPLPCLCTDSTCGAPLQVRRQFAERPGIMTYAEKPDYARCVSIVAASALKVRQ